MRDGGIGRWNKDLRIPQPTADQDGDVWRQHSGRFGSDVGMDVPGIEAADFPASVAATGGSNAASLM